MTKAATLETIDTKLDMYMASTDKAVTAMDKTIIAMSEAISVVSKSQAESKTMQVEINALSGRLGAHAQDIKDINKDVTAQSLLINDNKNLSAYLEKAEDRQKAMINKLLGSVVFVCLCAVAGLFIK